MELYNYSVYKVSNVYISNSITMFILFIFYIKININLDMRKMVDLDCMYFPST